MYVPLTIPALQNVCFAICTTGAEMIDVNCGAHSLFLQNSFDDESTPLCLVWEAPMVHVAKRFGISDVAPGRLVVGCGPRAEATGTTTCLHSPNASKWMRKKVRIIDSKAYCCVRSSRFERKNGGFGVPVLYARRL
jgi:hypothetical protein